MSGPRSSLVLPVDGDRSEEIRVRSLDSLLHEGILEPAAAIVADVEGFELEVLLGAEAFIERSPIRFMMLEFNRVTEQVSPGKVASVVKLLHRLGLVCYAIDDDYRGFRRPTPLTGCLTLIDRPDMAPKLRWSLGHVATAVKGWDPAAPPAWPALAPTEEAYALDVIRRMIYLRLAWQLPSVAGVALLTAIGAIASAW